MKGRLRLLVEAESLFNDGTAAVLFMVVLSLLSGAPISPAGISLSFATMVVGGLVLGAGVAGAALLLAGRTDDHLVEVTFNSLAAYASFLLAEHFHLSGVLATMSAGLVLGNYGSLGSISDRGRETVESFWEYVAFVANSLIFLLIGLRLAHSSVGQRWMEIPIVIGLTLLGRAAAVWERGWRTVSSVQALPL